MKELSNFISFLNGLIQEKEFVLNMDLFFTLKNMKDPIADLLISLNRKEIDSNINYIGLSDKDGMVSYLPSNVSTNDMWGSEKRVLVKMGRLIKAILTKMNITSFNDVMIENFINKYKSFQSGYFFKIVQGKEIKKWYSEINVDEGGETKSSLYNSCMRYHTCQNFLNIYTKIDTLSMLCLFNSKTHKLMGRALIWKEVNVITDKSSDEISYMDRIYTIDQKYESIFKQYALDNSLWFKIKQTDEERGITNGVKTLDPKKEKVVLMVELPKMEYDQEKKPFLDTFKLFGYYLDDTEIIPVICIFSSDFISLNIKEIWMEQNGTVIKLPKYDSSKDIFGNKIN